MTRPRPRLHRPGALAQRMGREHNYALDGVPDELMRTGGVLVFNQHGALLKTQASDTFSYPPGSIVYPVRPHKVTYVEVQAWLDARR